MFITQARLVVPAGAQAHEALASTSGDHEKIEVYSGTKAVKNYGISVEGSGTEASGHIDGSIETYDFKALYQIYNLQQNVSAHYWFVTYSKHTDHDELKKTFESSQTVTSNYTLDFTIQGNDYGINSVFITYQVIRLVVGGQTKDYVVTNSDSAGAATPDGQPYPGKFTPVPSGGSAAA